jgi:hypothetical protein
MNVDSSYLHSDDMAPAIAAPVTGIGNTAVRTASTVATVTVAIGRGRSLRAQVSSPFLYPLSFSSE